MLTIGGLAKKTGTKVQTIRYYEQIGLLPEPDRTEGDRDAIVMSNSTNFHLFAIRGSLVFHWKKSGSSWTSAIIPTGPAARLTRLHVGSLSRSNSASRVCRRFAQN